MNELQRKTAVEIEKNYSRPQLYLKLVSLQSITCFPKSEVKSFYVFMNANIPQLVASVPYYYILHFEVFLKI
jgi:hypothetical protein